MVAFRPVVEGVRRDPSEQTMALRLTVERGQVTGVDVRRDGAPGHARARREVILAAGAIESPKLLMLGSLCQKIWPGEGWHICKSVPSGTFPCTKLYIQVQRCTYKCG